MSLLSLQRNHNIDVCQEMEIHRYTIHIDHSLVAQIVKNPSAMREAGVRSLGWEDPLEEGMATHSSIHAWKIPKDRESWWATVHGVAKSQT